ncbi:MAG: efflux RND transporter periplasmic adaptor subunit [Planctomycetota bacterium]
MSTEKVVRRSSRIVTQVATGAVFLVVVVLLLLWLAGTFHQKIGDTEAALASHATAGRPLENTPLATARTIRIRRTESCVGTIGAVHEVSVASRLLARVLDVRVIAGQRVNKGDILVQLDDEDLAARMEQAQAAAAGARAARDQARIDYDRIKRLVEQQAASKTEWDRIQTGVKSAEAELARTEQVVNEAQTVLGYATIGSPITGVVVDKKVEAGDTITPGQVLLTLYDPTRMQLVASVRESLTRRLVVGQTVEVHVDALDKTCEGQVSEIVPKAESASRSFSVKVTGPCPPGIYSGMFGRLLLPLDQEDVLVVPRAALRRIGQLDVVEVADGHVLRRRAVQLGRTVDEDVEILSGLRTGERVALLTTGEPNGREP